MTLDTPCIEYQGTLNDAGYGRYYRRRAHRVAWELYRGAMPPGMVVCHKCDNPPCINLDHLFLGTIGDNSRDMVSKGRHTKQKRTHCPKGHSLTDPANLVPCQLEKGHRFCLTCSRAHGREAAALMREAVAILGITWSEYRRVYGSSKYTAMKIIADGKL